MLQYMTVKEANKDCLVFFRLGDFYEMFFEDAVTGSRELELTLTGRDCGLAERAPMCGVPYHAVDTYIARLVQKGYRVAVCEQGEENKGLMARSVTRVVTPGTVTDLTGLEDAARRYLLCVCGGADGYGVAYTDLTTGEVNADVLPRDTRTLNDFLLKIRPAEVICNEFVLAESFALDAVAAETVPPFAARVLWAYEEDNARALVEARLHNVRAYAGRPLALAATGALLAYVDETQKKEVKHLVPPGEGTHAAVLTLDANTRRNLELFEGARDRKKHGSLLWVLDKTATAMGARLLRRWMDSPLCDVAAIDGRLDAVEELVNAALTRDNLRAAFARVRDVERLAGKAGMGNLNPRDCLALRDALSAAPAVLAALAPLTAAASAGIRDAFDPVDDVCALLSAAIDEDAPALTKDGGYIRAGYDDRLDKIRNVGAINKELVARMEADERAHTGIKNLKVGYNRIFGYYIEVNRNQLAQVPLYYQRKQTTATGERFITADLKSLETMILSGEEEALKLEAALFEAVAETVTAAIARLQAFARDIAALDVLSALAVVAAGNGYVRPTLSAADPLKIVDGRHPIVERLTGSRGEYVPNNTLFDDETRVSVITGPNMGGKSTYMRQVALIVYMAHLGSFVPARVAAIPLTDRIFTRVGASDDLASGRSTFMVEMTEVAEILSDATSKSLLVLDEIGRGTGTLDGLSIAWAVMEHVSKEVGAKTLFATHYHELTDLESVLPGVKNYRVAAKETQDGVIFLYKIVRGKADKSFGVEVATLAGLPKAVTDRAKALLSKLEMHNLKKVDGKLSAIAAAQPSLFDYHDTVSRTAQEAVDVLKGLAPDRMTPLEALKLLAELVEKVKT
ncbi:MAG: DNA mismatch repair protein MutS [Clostridiales bacterium]|nr:DNA mismatch repair protein MutS [Clostridiales bacterium]